MFKKEKYPMLLIIVLAWLLFLFGDAYFSHQQNSVPNQQSISGHLQQLPAKILSSGDQQLVFSSQEQQLIQTDNLQQLQQNTENKNIATLKYLYQTTKKPEVLKMLIQLLVAQNMFTEAKKYLDITPINDKIIEPILYLYVTFNTLDFQSSKDLETFKGMVESYKQKNYIDEYDYAMYRALIDLWEYKYEEAQSLLATIASPRYQELAQQLQDIFAKSKIQKDMPQYYTDSLIAVTVLKKGFFSLAEKLSLESIQKDDSYILPYQILSYISLITQQYESAEKYLLMLQERDATKTSRYTFLIGVASYRQGKYDQALMYLQQVRNITEVKTDAYRYMLLIYYMQGDLKQQMQTRQKMLGQYDLEKTDFYTIFQRSLYIPFSQGEKSMRYQQNPDMLFDTVALCYEKIPQEETDICIYGEVGLDIAKNNRTAVKDNLIYLAKKYPTSYVLQALGDYAYQHGNIQEAKTYYLQSISAAEQQPQKEFLKQKLIDETLSY